MPPDTKMRKLTGNLRQLLFSPKGGLEGFLLAVGAETIQVSMNPSTADVGALAKALGRHMDVRAQPDQSAKTKEAAHPVYKLHSIQKISGKTFKSSASGDRVSGSVAAFHYAKHGEPNGVMLQSGEFIHTRPHGMKKLKLRVGSKVVARGERRMTVLGTTLIEAREVNRVAIE